MVYRNYLGSSSSFGLYSNYPCHLMRDSSGSANSWSRDSILKNPLPSPHGIVEIYFYSSESGMTRCCYNLFCHLLIWLKLGKFRFLTVVVMLQFSRMIFLWIWFRSWVFKKVFFPLGKFDLTPCGSKPKSFSSERYHIFMLGALMGYQYFITLPDNLLMAKVVTCWCWFSHAVLVSTGFFRMAVVVVSFRIQTSLSGSMISNIIFGRVW